MLEALDFPVTPSNLLALKLLPTRVLVRGMALMSRVQALRQMFAASGSRLGVQEAPTLGGQIVSLADRVDVPLPHYRRLLAGQ